jgi:hypothetical protein
VVSDEQEKEREKEDFMRIVDAEDIVGVGLKSKMQFPI